MSLVCRFTPVTFYCCVRGPAFRLCRWKWDYSYSLPLSRRRLCLSVILSMCRITAKVISQFHLNLSRRDVHSRLTNRQPMSTPVCNTRRPGSSTNQIGKMRKKKFLCVWSAAVELTTTDCPWCIIDTDSVWRTSEDFSVFQSLRDIIIAPLWQFWL